jgi:hypothetical protein
MLSVNTLAGFLSKMYKCRISNQKCTYSFDDPGMARARPRSVSTYQQAQLQLQPKRANLL